MAPSTEPITVPHAEFYQGLPAGRFRLIVNPERAKKYIRHQLFIVAVMQTMLGIGAALTLSSYP